MKVTRWAGAAAAGVLLALSAAAPAHAETVRQGQWYLDALSVPEAQRISTGQGVVVGVIDGVGVDAQHPDLAGQVLPGAAFGVDSPNGWSTAADASHATGVAGIIAAKGGGDMHALGIAPGARILPVAVPKAGSHNFISPAIRWAVDHGAKVINISLSTGVQADPAEVDAVRYAFTKDVVVVAAAGNTTDGDTQVISPANIPGVLAVSGVGHHAEFWSGSVSGPEVAISAPSVDMVTPGTPAKNPSGYSAGIGTSFASPVVAAAAAMIRSKFPGLNAASVVNRLIATARDHGPTGRDPQFGFGTVRILNALTTDVPNVTANPLGAPSAAPSTSSTGGTAGGAAHTDGMPVAILAIAGVFFLVLIVVVVVIVVAANRRRPARPVPPQPYGPPVGYGPPPHGYGPPPHAGGPPPPPGQYPPQRRP
jgi:type VII secretion-associated serine protease mycosin